MKTKLISAPSPAVSLAEAKSYFRILHDDEDADISRAIMAAQEKAEQITNRVLVKSTFEVTVDDFSDVKLEKTPLLDVSKIEYISTDGTIKEVTEFVYEMNVVDDRALVMVLEVPSDLKSGRGNVTITYEAGYETVPSQIQSYILIHGLTMFENRHLSKVEGEIDDGSTAYYGHLLDSYRIIPV